MSMSRADRSGFAAWWWTIDRVALFAMLGLITIGLILAFAASPAATGGPLTAGDFRYAAKQVGIRRHRGRHSCRRVGNVAACDQDFIRRHLCAGRHRFRARTLTGSEVLGAKRWIDMGWMTLAEPSEFSSRVSRCWRLRFFPANRR